MPPNTKKKEKGCCEKCQWQEDGTYGHGFACQNPSCDCHTKPDMEKKHLIKTCLNIDCPERKGGRCTAGENGDIERRVQFLSGDGLILPLLKRIEALKAKKK